MLNGALYMGPNPMFRVDVGGPALDISSTKVFHCQNGNLAVIAATCAHPLIPDIAAVDNLCTTITPGGVAGCEWATVSYPGATGTRFQIYNWSNGATGTCLP